MQSPGWEMITMEEVYVLERVRAWCFGAVLHHLFKKGGWWDAILLATVIIFIKVMPEIWHNDDGDGADVAEMMRAVIIWMCGWSLFLSGLLPDVSQLRNSSFDDTFKALQG